MFFVNFVYNVMTTSLKLAISVIALLAAVIISLYVLLFGLKLLSKVVDVVNKKFGITSELDE